MKKVTGKALSLVLSLALVVSSFSASFASAATRTADGIVNDTDNDKIYLVNGGESDDAKQSLELNAWIGAKLQTKDHEDVDSIKVSAVSHVSGNSLVSLKTTDNGDNAYLKLKSKSVKGTEVISVLYKGDYTDDDGNDYTVKARKNFTVYVYDKDAPILAEVKDSNNPGIVPGNGCDDVYGKGLDDFETFAKTRNTTKTVGLYLAEPASKDNATVKFSPIYVTTNKNGFDISKSDKRAGLSVDDVKDSAYYLEITDGKNDIHFDNSTVGQKLAGEAKTAVDQANAQGLIELNADANTALRMVSGSSYGKDTVTGSPTYNHDTYTKDASTTNVTFTLKKITSTGKVSTSSDDKYTFKTKVEKKIDVAQAYWNAKGQGATLPGTYNVKKSNGRTRLDGVIDPLSNDAKNDKYLDVTDCELVFPAGTKGSVDIGDDEDSVNVKKISGTVGQMSIGEDAHVGSIDIDGGTVEVNGKVGDIKTDDGLGTTDDGSVTVKGKATVGDINTGDADTTSSTGAVTITGGTVGDITSHDKNGAKISIDGEDSDDTITTGVITGPEMEIYSDEAKVTIGGIKVNGDDGTIDFEGDNLEIKAIDLDSYNTNLQIGDDDDDDKAFTGTLPEVKNALNATIKTENEDTKATISGDVNADTIDMDSDTELTLNGNTQAKTIEGDGTLTVPAGKLYVTDSVSSTKLKLSDKTLAVGTVVFKSKADTVSDDDFDCYGFTLSKASGNTVDTFKIASLKFAGMQISGGPSELTVGQSATYTASAYPTGTAVPTGYTVEWSLDGGSSDVFTLTSSGNSAAVKVNSLDTTFASENKTALTATLYDADGYQVDDYAPATFDITATATPSVALDTGATVNVAQGASYTFKATSSDGSEPKATIGGSAFTLTKVGKSGNAYFYKITAVGKVGDAAGFYINGTRRTVATITASSLKLDTGAKLSVKAGATYTVKATAPSKVTCTTGNSAVFKLVSSSVSGNNYFFKVQATGKAGASTGLYFNGVRYIVATVA